MRYPKWIDGWGGSTPPNAGSGTRIISNGHAESWGGLEIKPTKDD